MRSQRTRLAVTGRHAGRAVFLVLAVLVAGFGHACFKLDDDDCTLSSTCSGQSLTHYTALVGEACAACARIKRQCFDYVKDCDKEPLCVSSVECALKPNPAAIQACYADVLRSGPFDAGATLPPWEVTRKLDECISDRCAQECRRDLTDWSCSEDPAYKVPEAARLPYEAVLYVRFFTPEQTEPAGRVQVRHCGGEHCTDAGQTNEDGVLTLPDKEMSTAIHFELKDTGDPPRFPPTLFYPRPIELGGRQPIALYLVRNQLVGLANGMLGTDAGVLTDRAQSIVLTDACWLQARRSAPGVTIRVIDTPTPLCRRDGQSPCVWYGDPLYYLPEPERAESSGTSTGVLGLPDGKHTIQACSDGKVVASRQVQMRKGWLTFARLWPLTQDERKDLGDDLTCRD